MKYLLFPFFLFQLGWHTLNFIFKVIWADFTWSGSLLLAGCIFIFQLLFFLDRTLAFRQGLYQAALQTVYKNQYQQRLSNLEIEWQKLLQQQPTSRDALINLSLIDGELGKKDQQALFQKQALQVDPNFRQ